MLNYDICSLDDLISDKFNQGIADAAMDVAIAFSAMDATQIITACHHDYRLSDELRDAARKLSLRIEEASRARGQDWEHEAYCEADRLIDEMKAAC